MILFLKALILSIAMADSDPRLNSGSAGAVLTSGANVTCSCKQDQALQSQLSYVANSDAPSKSKAEDEKTPTKKGGANR